MSIRKKTDVEIKIDDISNMVSQILSPYIQKKRGRPKSKRNITTKTYEKISISVTMEEKEKIKIVADQEYDGNISELVKSLLRNKKII